MDLDGKDVVAFHQFCDEASLPDSQERVPITSRHSTLFAFAKFEEGVGPYKDPERGARLLFKHFAAGRLPTLLNDLKRFSFRPVLRRDTKEGGTTIQFEASDPSKLAALRTQTQAGFEIFLTQSIWGLSNAFNCEYPYWHDQKNEGSLLWGSLGRPKEGTTGPDETTDTKLEKFSHSEFQPRKLILAVSNDSLSNPLTIGETYVEIPLGI